MNRPLYTALGVERDASQSEIKEAWRRLVRELHPDRNPRNPEAAARFRSVRAAWDVLGDPKRRALYDEFGEDATSAFFDPELVRPQKTGRLWSDDARTPTNKYYAVSRGEDYRTTLHLDHAEADRGGLFETFVRLPEVCPTCDGTGWRPNKRACGKCTGGLIPGIGPWGIPIPAGVVDGQLFVARKEGARGRGQGAQPGDLWVTVRVPPRFVDRGPDQVVAVPIPRGVLLEGGKIRVPLPDGGAVRVTVPPNTPEGRELRVGGKGRAAADLFVRLDALPGFAEVWAMKAGLG